MPYSLLDVQNKYGGSTPISLSEYYRNGGRVADTVGNAGVPTSGSISVSQLQSGANTSSASTILTHVWDNRTNYFFKANNDNQWVWPGDVYNRTNSPINRYVNSYIVSSGIAPSAPNYSNYVSVIGFASGSAASITNLGTPGSPVLYEANTGAEMSWWIVHVELLPTSLTVAQLYVDRISANTGSWAKLLILPGRWAFDASARISDMAYTWSRTLASGRVGWFATGNGYDYDMTPPTAGTTSNIIRGSEWWYNNSVSYVQFNSSGGNYTFQVGATLDPEGNPEGIWTVARRYNEFYLIG